MCFNNRMAVWFILDISSFKYSHRSHKVCYAVKQRLEREIWVQKLSGVITVGIGIIWYGRFSEAETFSVSQTQHVVAATQEQMREKQKQPGREERQFRLAKTATVQNKATVVSAVLEEWIRARAGASPREQEQHLQQWHGRSGNGEVSQQQQMKSLLSAEET